MRDALIVSTARTPLTKSYRGTFNNTTAPTMAGWAIEEAVKRSGVDPEKVDDVIMGAALQQGTTHCNVARNAALAAGLPVTVSGMTLDRQCSSGMMAIATAAKQIISDGMDVVVGGGLDSISLVQTEKMNLDRWVDKKLISKHKHIYMPMLKTAEVVANRYNISRESQDEYSLQSQLRTAKGQDEGKFDDEIISVTTTMGIMDKETKEISFVEKTSSKDECNRPTTTIEGLSSLKPVVEGGSITAGNASQLSDGASACVLMESSIAAKYNVTPLGIYRGIAVAGCEPDEMGIGPVFSVPKLLNNYNLSMDDIDIWELNEAFAVQVVYCRDKLGIPMEKLNLDGGSISIGHPFGMTGSRQVGHIVRQLHSHDKQFGVVTMCIGGGMGASGLFERYPS